ncbi:hypothetical protein BDV37DRAFT_250865 [Aspergillus pseudonomiae]|uniref:Uncharacterized protein n=1 Tax=Aspergillus pseudonomiae TaxID=1506151 RepID=A0A5N7DBP4_9EURO|nr:uncharacterized protein BDV37DRAFT_250865 [Aspergillus pseudonomiae]KAE8403198.1 hypothetical protein BDV37DRAFT_250865 [Aspergillus pseudonomiae]
MNNLIAPQRPHQDMQNVIPNPPYSQSDTQRLPLIRRGLCISLVPQMHGLLEERSIHVRHHTVRVRISTSKQSQQRETYQRHGKGSGAA